jgi:hypothetical protein
MELRYWPDQMTRYVAIYKAGKLVFVKNFRDHETSQKIMKTVPLCSVLHTLAAGGEAPRVIK